MKQPGTAQRGRAPPCPSPRPEGISRHSCRCRAKSHRTGWGWPAKGVKPEVGSALVWHYALAGCSGGAHVALQMSKNPQPAVVLFRSQSKEDRRLRRKPLRCVFGENAEVG